MKYLSITFVLVFISCSVFAQNSPIKIETEKDHSTIKFFATNNLKQTQEVKLELTDTRGIKGYSNPISKAVAPGKRTLLTTVSYSGAHSYKMSYGYGSTSSRSMGTSTAQKNRNSASNDFGDISTGIVVFEKNGCGRCNMSTDYLLDNNIKFKLINISERDGKGNSLMWDLMRKNGFKGGNIQTPVILVDGELSHSHKNLRKFLTKLGKR